MGSFVLCAAVDQAVHTHNECHSYLLHRQFAWLVNLMERTSWRTVRRWDGNIKIALKEVSLEVVNWIHPVQTRTSNWLL